MKIIRFLYDNWFDSATITASSANADFPLDNLQHPHHTRQWRSTGDEDEWVKWDFGDAKAVKALILKYHNFSATAVVKIQAHGSDAWGDPDLDETLTIVDDQIVKFWEAAQSYRWWRILVDDPDNTDGYIRLGRIYSGSYFSPSVNFSNVYSKKLVDPSVIRLSQGGQMYAAKFSKYRAFKFVFNFLNATDEATFDSIFWEYVGLHTPYFICRDAEEADTTTYYVENADDWVVDHVFMDSLFNLTIVVRESR